MRGRQHPRVGHAGRLGETNRGVDPPHEAIDSVSGQSRIASRPVDG